jgi:hypothetical protein
LVDDHGEQLDAEYSGVPDEPYVALILESRSGGNASQPPRNQHYDRALNILLARLGTLGAWLMDALVDTGHTQRLGIPEADRRLIPSPIQLAEVPDVDLLRREMGRAQVRIGRVSEAPRGGDSHKRIRLRVAVPDYQPADAERLAETLAAPIAEIPEKVLTDSGAEQAEEAAGDAAGKPARLDWTREEIILAMDLYVTSGAFRGGPIPGQRSAAIVQLSGLLQELSAYPKELQGGKYRNPEGVYLKLMNLRAIQTGGAHGMNAYSQRDAAVWREYADDLPRLHQEAEVIRARLREGAIQPAKAMPAMEDVDIEQQHTETYMVSPSSEPRATSRGAS